MIETILITFEAERNCDNWSVIFQQKELNSLYEAYGIKTLFRGSHNKNKKKILIIQQAEEGQIEKFMAKNGEFFLSLGLKPETIDLSKWTWG